MIKSFDQLICLVVGEHFRVYERGPETSHIWCKTKDIPCEGSQSAIIDIVYSKSAEMKRLRRGRLGISSKTQLVTRVAVALASMQIMYFPSTGPYSSTKSLDNI